MEGEGEAMTPEAGFIRSQSVHAVLVTQRRSVPRSFSCRQKLFLEGGPRRDPVLWNLC